MKPYKQKKTGNTIVRVFDENIDGHELIWHRDRNDRMVEVLGGDGWKFQMDNQIPIDMKLGTKLEIPKETFHRVWKGKNPLKIKIIEKNLT